MDDGTTAAESAGEQSRESPSRSRWATLRERRREANEVKSAGEWLDKAIEGVTAVGTYCLIALGFSASYSTIREIAQVEGGFSAGMSHIVPLSFEGGIIILSLRVLREARAGQRALLLRILVGLGSLATLVTNFHSGAQSIQGQLTHVVPVAMFIICFEYMVHSARRKALRDMGLLPPPLASLRPVEWLLDFPNAFARWRLMVLHGIHTTEHAMWVRQTLLIRKAAIAEQQASGKWRKAPKHVRLQMRRSVLEEGRQRFVDRQELEAASADNVTDDPAARSAPQASPIEGRPLAVPAQREPVNPDEQTALPPRPPARAQKADALSLASKPSGGSKPEEPTDTSQPESHDQHESQGTKKERRRAGRPSYEATLKVAREYLAEDRTRKLTGPMLAEDDRISVGARSVQRHLTQMVEDGVIPPDVVAVKQPAAA